MSDIQEGSSGHQDSKLFKPGIANPKDIDLGSTRAGILEQLHREDQEPMGDIDSVLPTTDAIISAGVDSYRRLYNDLSPDLQKKLHGQQGVQCCFLGLEPEVGQNSIPLDKASIFGESWLDVQSAISRNCPQMIVIKRSISERKPHTAEGDSLINIDAIRRVAEVHKDYFPDEARTRTREWLIENPQAYIPSLPGADKDSVVRAGLVSGFTREASENYELYHEANDELRDKLFHYGGQTSQSEEYLEVYNALYYAENPRSEEKLREVGGLIRKYCPDFEESKINLILAARTIPFPGFRGFSVFDERYSRRMEEIYKRSGISSI